MNGVLFYLLTVFQPNWFVVMQAEAATYRCRNTPKEQFCILADLVAIKAELGYSKKGDRDYDAFAKLMKKYPYIP